MSAGDGLAARHSASPSEVEQLYDGWVDTYDADIRSWGYAMPEQVARIAAEVAGPGDEVLDAGCGTGLVGVALAHLGLRSIVGIDLSPASVVVARERGVYTDVRTASLDDPLPFASGQFAAVVCAGVLSYVADVGSTLTRLVHVTRPGGRVVFTHRTDLWDAQDLDAVLSELEQRHRLTVDVSEPQPYLPGHDEFGDTIQAIITTLTLAV